MSTDELIARIVAQQQQITALHSELTFVRSVIDAEAQPELAARVDAVLGLGESDYAAQIEAEIARRVDLIVNPAQP